MRMIFFIGPRLIKWLTIENIKRGGNPIVADIPAFIITRINEIILFCGMG